MPPKGGPPAFTGKLYIQEGGENWNGWDPRLPTGFNGFIKWEADGNKWPQMEEKK